MATGFGGFLNDNNPAENQPESGSGQGFSGFLGTPKPKRTEKSARAARAAQVDDTQLDDILAREGAMHLKPIVKAIYGQESGSGANAVTSVDGARGGMQVIPATFKRFAKEGESIDNPRDNMAVAARYIKFLNDKAGGDPAKIAVGYFSGEGNIGTDKPWKEDRKDGNGKSTSAYAQDVVRRVGGAKLPTPANVDMSNAPSWKSIASDERFAKLTPEEKDQARSEYFKTWIEPAIKPEERGAYLQWFDQESRALEPKPKGIIDTLGDAVTGAANMLGEAYNIAGDAIGKAITNENVPGTGFVDPMTGADVSGGAAPAEAQPAQPAAPAAQPIGSVMDSLPADQRAPASTTPLNEQTRAFVERTYNTATPEQRAAMAQHPSALGDYARFVNQQYQQRDASMPQGATADMNDPRWEGRARRLARNGQHGSLVEAEAKNAAKKGVAIGDEIGQATVSDFDFDAQKLYNNDPFYSNPAVRAGVKGVEGLRQGIYGVNQAFAEFVGADEFAATQAKAAKASRGKTEAMGEPKNYFAKNFEGAMSSIAQQLPTLLAGAATGSMILPLAAMGVTTFGQEYAEGRAKGQTGGEAATRAGLFGAFEILGERFGLGNTLQAIKLAAKGAPTGDIATLLARAMLKEIPGEELTTLGQFLTDKLGGNIGLNPEAGLAEYLSQAGDTLVQTVMQGGMMMAGTTGVGATVRHLTNKGESDRLQETLAEAAKQNAMDKADRMFGARRPTKDTSVTDVDYREPDKEPKLPAPVGDTSEEPKQPAAAPAPTPAPAEAAPEIDVLGFAETRRQTLEAKRDGYIDAQIGAAAEGEAAPSAEALTPAEEAELDFLDENGQDEAKVRDYYKLNPVQAVPDDMRTKPENVNTSAPDAQTVNTSAPAPETAPTPAPAPAPAPTPAPEAAKPTTWQESEFAPRIEKVLTELREAGADEYARILEAGFNMDAKQGRLKEEGVAFREEKARGEINRLAEAGKPPKPVKPEPMTVDRFKKENDSAAALPDSILEAAVAKFNEYADKLGELGFKYGEVDSRHPKEAQELHTKLKEIDQAIFGLATRRYQQKRGHKKLNPEAVEREEDNATAVLGIDTRAHPGVDDSRQVTLGQGIKEKQPKTEKQKRQEKAEAKPEPASAEQAAAEADLAAALGELGDVFGKKPKTEKEARKAKDEPERPTYMGQPYEFNDELDVHTKGLHMFVKGDVVTLKGTPLGNATTADIHEANGKAFINISGPGLFRTKEYPSLDAARKDAANQIRDAIEFMKPENDAGKMDAHLAGIEKALANGVSNATTTPSTNRSGKVGYGTDSVKLYEEALERAGWTPLGKKKQHQWTKGSHLIDLRSQGDGAAPIVTFKSDGNAESPASEAAQPARQPAQQPARRDARGQATRDRLWAENPFMGFLGEHGVNTADRADTGGEGRRPVMIPGYGPLYRNAAPRLDELALLAQEQGFLTQADIEADDDTGGTIKLADMIQRAAHNKEIIGRAFDTAQEPTQDVEAELVAEAEKLGIDVTGMTMDQVYDAVADAYRQQQEAQSWDADADFAAAQQQAGNLDDATLKEVDEIAGMRALGFTEEEIANAIEERKNREGAQGAEETDAGAAAGDHDAGNGQAGIEGFDLTGQTETEARLEAERTERARREQRRREQAPDPSDFMLTGSDRDADKAAANGAQELFGDSDTALPQDDLSAEQQAAMDDLKNALGDLGDLLGKNSRLNITPEQQEKILPILSRVFGALFRLGKVKFKIAARAAMQLIRDNFGDEVANEIELIHLQSAYLANTPLYRDKGIDAPADVFTVPSMEALYEGENDVPATGNDSEQGSAPDDAQDQDGDAPVHDGPDATGRSDAGAGTTPESGGARPVRSGGVSRSGSASGGTGGHRDVFGKAGEHKPSFGPAGADQPGGSNGNGGNGTDGNEQPGKGGTESDVPKADVTDLSFAQKVQKQLEANNIRVKFADRANVDETLPLLLEGQREDVFKTEVRWAKPDGYGMLFTNGTGTGKTYLGLGVVRRQVSMGRKNGLVIVPDDAVIAEWLKSAKTMGLELHELESMSDAGRGVSITTYANLAGNRHLADRDYDFVIADEAHKLMANAQAKETGAIEQFRAITLHPSGALQRANMVERELVDELKGASEHAEALRSLFYSSEGRENLEQYRQLEKELREAEDKARKLHDKFLDARDKQAEYIAARQGEKRPRAMFLSATPFAYEQNIQWAAGYLFEYPEVRMQGYNTPTPYGQFMIENFGWRMRTGKLNEPDAKVDRGLMQIQFNKRLRAEGVLSTRLLDVPADYDRKFMLVNAGIGARIDAALDWIRTEKDGMYYSLFKQADDQFDYLSRQRLLEALKAEAAIPYIKSQHALGRKVVVFYNYNEGGGFNPFRWNHADSDMILGGRSGKEAAFFKFGDFRKEFQAKFPDLVGDFLSELESPLNTLTKAFPKAGIWNGQGKVKKGRKQSLIDFNDDDKPENNLLIVQAAAAAGWSGHDTTGKFPRVLLNLGLPTAPVVAIQQEGRIYRVGQVSNAMFRYMNTGTLFERAAFATKIAERAATVENLALGEEARALKEVFIEAFLNSGDYPASLDEGTGGKLGDRAIAKAVSEFQKAKALYYAQRKRDANTKAQEGVDYFATPEPIGLKMVEWLGLQDGERFLEPSAGHGAIARWASELTSRTVIEPSAELASRLALAVGNAKIINDSFEELHVVNKFDGIAMNPPFGTGGKTAMEHVAKAFTHLADGGRLVALVPQGPAMEKRFDAWLGSEAAEDAIIRMVIDLPASTFKRAGTSVATRIVVIDRHADPKAREMLPVWRDEFRVTALENKDIEQVFDALETMEAPAKYRSEVPTPTQAAAAARSETSAEAGSDLSQFYYELDGDKIVTDAPAVEYKTQKGKILKGAYVPDKAMAQKVDAFTFKARGMPGYFVRDKHLLREGGSPFQNLEDGSGMERATVEFTPPQEESNRVNARQKLIRLKEQLDAERISMSDYVDAVERVVREMNRQSDRRMERDAFSPLERGEDIVREKLYNARRRSRLDGALIDMTLWMLDQNPNLAHGVSLSIRTSRDGTPQGDYNPASRVIRLFSQADSDTGVHEFMHHSERMMPEDVQEGIRREWLRGWTAEAKAALRRKDFTVFHGLMKIMDAKVGDRRALNEAYELFRSGKLDKDQYYQYLNPSEYWAVNAARILARRFTTDQYERSWINRAAQWLRELAEKIKGWLGLRSDAPILRGLNEILNSDGGFVSNTMLWEEGARMFADFNNIGASRRAATQKASETLYTWFGPTKDSFKMRHKLFSTQLHKSKINAAFKPVFVGASRLLNHVSVASVRAADLAPNILPRADKVSVAARTFVFGSKSERKMRKVADAIFAGTLQSTSVYGGKVWSDADLQTKFGMSKEERQMYFEARDAINQSLMEAGIAEAWAHAHLHIPQQLRETVIDHIELAEDVIVDALKRTMAAHELRIQNFAADLKQAEKQRDKVKAPWKAATEKAEEFRKFNFGRPMPKDIADELAATKAKYDAAVADVAAAEMGLAEAQRAAAPVGKAIETVRQVFETVGRLQQAGYAPLSRFGPYTVEVVAMENGKPKRIAGEVERVWFSRFDNEWEARKAEQEMRKKYPDANAFSISRGKIDPNEYKKFQGINPETLALFAEVIGQSKALEKFYSLAVSDRSVLKRRLDRDGIAGFSEDLPRVLASFITSNARYAAQRFYLRDIKKGIAGIHYKDGDTLAEARALEAAVIDPQETGARARAFMFMMYMGGSVAAAAINATQSITMTLPYLAQYGVARASRAISAAIPYAMGLRKIDPKSKLGIALKKASDEGKVDAQEIFHLYSVAISGTTAKIGGDALRSRTQAGMTLLGSMFSIVEKMNRRIAFIAAYNLAEQTGQPAPYTFAVDAVDETQGIYNKANIPNLSRNLGGALFLQFKTYAINYVELQRRLWRSGAAGKRAVVYSLAILILFAGIEGLPFMKLINDMIDTIGQLAGYNTNAKRWKREVLESFMPKVAADFALNGVSAVLPFDVANRMGLHNIVPATDLFKKSNDEKLRSGAEIFGAPSGIVKNVFDAWESIEAGRAGAAANAVMPKFIKDIGQGAEMATSGMATDAKGRKVAETGKGDAALQALGFNPAVKAEGSRRRNEFYQDRKMSEAMQEEISNQFARGIVANDRQMQADALKKMNDWNKSNPEMPVRITQQGMRGRVQAGLSDADERMIRSTPKHQRAEAMRRLKGE